MKFAELEAEQKKPLAYKIDRACEAIEKAFSLSRHVPALAFSGGKDSTVLWDLIRRYFPHLEPRLHVIYGNTGVEYPESLRFAREIGVAWGGGRFHEVTPLKLEKDGLKYEAQCEVLQYLTEHGRLSEILKPDGKLKYTSILDNLCPPEMWENFKRRNLIWRDGTPKSYFWCVDQYGWPLLGKAFSKLKAHRINIDCFLRYSQSKSEKSDLLDYYDILQQVKISQACCDILKKEPSEAMQAELGVDVIFKGLMAAESRTRKTNFCTRGYLFESCRKHLPDGDSFWHCNPISIWTDDDIWDYIHRFEVPYSPLYDMGWQEDDYCDGEYHKIKRNGCMACGTDLLFPNNHLASLRHTHPKAWEVFMRRGLADEILKLQRAKRNGQYSIFDYCSGTDYLIDSRPCAFDRIDQLVLDEVASASDMREYDAEDEGYKEDIKIFEEERP